MLCRRARSWLEGDACFCLFRRNQLLAFRSMDRYWPYGPGILARAESEPTILSPLCSPGLQTSAFRRWFAFGAAVSAEVNTQIGGDVPRLQRKGGREVNSGEGRLWNECCIRGAAEMRVVGCEVANLERTARDGRICALVSGDRPAKSS